MNERHPDEEFGQEAADRLLDALAAGHRPRGRDGASAEDPLAGLLAAASAPGRPDELTGEDAAVAAFRAASAERAREAAATRVLPAAPHRRRVGGRGLKRLLTVKAAVAALAAVSLGGVALAAGTGNLPGQTPSHQHGTPHPKRSGNHGGSEESSGVDPANPSGTHGPTVSGSPSPSPGKPTEKGKEGEGNGNGHPGNPHGQPPKGEKSTPPGSGNGNGNGNGSGNGNGNGKGKGGGGGEPDKQLKSTGPGSGSGSGSGETTGAPAAPPEQ